MELAKNLAPEYNPIDVVENIFSSRSFAWEANMQCMHLSCLMDIETKIEDRSKIFELLALVNEELWVGHFSYWTEQNIPVFKHSVILNDGEDIESKISQIIDIAIKECERMYPIFKVVLTKGMDPKQALYPMMMATVGQA